VERGRTVVGEVGGVAGETLEEIKAERSVQVMNWQGTLSSSCSGFLLISSTSLPLLSLQPWLVRSPLQPPYEDQLSSPLPLADVDMKPVTSSEVPKRFEVKKVRSPPLG
jgi:hypothetical protein